MPQIYFSKSENGFFVEGISLSLPADKVPISDEVWRHLIANQSPTSQLSSDAGGNPILIDTIQGNKVIYSAVGAA